MYNYDCVSLFFSVVDFYDIVTVCFWIANYVYERARIRVCECDREQVLYGSNYWQQGPSDTHSASHSGPSGMYLPPPFPFSFWLSFPLSFFLPLSFFNSFSFCLFGLNYFRMSCNKRGQGEAPLHAFYCEEKPHHILIQITHFQFAQTSPENTSANYTKPDVRACVRVRLDAQRGKERPSPVVRLYLLVCKARAI